METNRTSKRVPEGPIVDPPKRGGNVDFRDGLAAIIERIFPDFHEAFTQLHLGQLHASVKCLSMDRRDGGIYSYTDDIVWNYLSSSSRVDEDLGISIAGHEYPVGVERRFLMYRTT